MKKLHYKTLLLKRRIEAVFIFPFIFTGRLLSLLSASKKEYDIYFFFPFYHIGGAEKVHAQVAQVFKGRNAIIYFTKKSHNDLFWKEFESTGFTIKDISRHTDNKWLYFLNLIYRGIITGHINRQKNKPVIFNGQCNFAYKISPWINKGIRQVELIHSLNSFSYIRIPFLPFISSTVMISRQRIKDHEALYKQLRIPAHYLDKIVYISNAIKIPTLVSTKQKTDFRVLYTGRGGIEKRVHLIAAMAEQLANKSSSIQFEMLGDVSNVIPTEKYPYILFYGNQSDPQVIEDIYRKASVLLLTSDTEGFPMVVIEAMMYGCVPVATPVGDIPFHLKNNENGFLFSSVSSEETIIREGVGLIEQLKNNKEEFDRLSENASRYAREHFELDIFNKSYQKVLTDS